MSTKVNSKIEELFMEFPSGEFHLREIARICRISPRTAKKYLGALLLEGAIKRRNDRLYEFYSANMESQVYRDMKMFYNLKKLRKSGIIDYINEELHNPAIVLFGSAAKGQDTEKSDIDLFILARSRKTLDIKSFERKLGREIQAFLFTEENLRQITVKNKELLNSVINGVVISGMLEVFK